MACVGIFGIGPDMELSAPHGADNVTELIADLLSALGTELRRPGIHAVVVQGDASSAHAGASGLPAGHGVVHRSRHTDVRMAQACDTRRTTDCTGVRINEGNYSQLLFAGGEQLEMPALGAAERLYLPPGPAHALGTPENPRSNAPSIQRAYPRECWPASSMNPSTRPTVPQWVHV